MPIVVDAVDTAQATDGDGVNAVMSVEECGYGLLGMSMEGDVATIRQVKRQ
jgi:hypothetical protein